MYIDITQYDTTDVYGRICAVQIRATITHSPREGFDDKKLGKLEDDLGEFLTRRINAAIKPRGAK